MPPASPLGRTPRDPVLDSKNNRILCFCVHSQLQCHNSYSIYSVLAAIIDGLSRSGQPPQDNLKQRQTVCISLQLSTRWSSKCSFFIYVFLPIFLWELTPLIAGLSHCPVVPNSEHILDPALWFEGRNLCCSLACTHHTDLFLPLHALFSL